MVYSMCYIGITLWPGLLYLTSQSESHGTAMPKPGNEPWAPDSNPSALTTDPMVDLIF